MFSDSNYIETVALDAATKQKISHWLEQMREAVQNADISREKKDRLFSLINKLRAGIDRESTPVQAVGELWLTVCAYVGQGVQRLEPIVQGIERIGAALGIARELNAGARGLPQREEPKRIEPPKKKNSFERDLDDGIPF